MRKLITSLLIATSCFTTSLAFAGPKVEFKTNMGNFTVEVDTDKAPKTSANFLNYVKSGFYNGTIFHRVIDGFMIQGGGFTQDLNQKPTDAPVASEAHIGSRPLQHYSQGLILNFCLLSHLVPAYLYLVNKTLFSEFFSSFCALVKNLFKNVFNSFLLFGPRYYTFFKGLVSSIFFKVILICISNTIKHDVI